MTEIDIHNPLSAPYRTGSYLIYDAGTGVASNFRSAADLIEHPYRASGSHQLDLGDLISVLNGNMIPHQPRRLFLVDLREESHGYLDGRAVSWYSDNDFSNVGVSWPLLEADEEARLKVLERRRVQLFEIADDGGDDLQQERVIPLSFADLVPSSVRTEREVAGVLENVFEPMQVIYERIPVTDHCAPSEFALNRIESLFERSWSDDWVHFHCHGGDGRTTTFLCLWDMLSWIKRHPGPYPTLGQFAQRQYELFPYCLDPSGSSCGSAPISGWKLSLAQKRWDVLEGFLRSLVRPL